MTQSRFDPFKSRLKEVFGASSSGDNPYGNPPLPVTPRRKKKKRVPDWEKESEHLFEDFLSLDEEKITQGLAKARVRKAMEKKYGQARLTEETAAMEDTLQVEGVDSEKTRQKRAMAARFVSETHTFLGARYPEYVRWLDILDKGLWQHLLSEGLAPRFVLNLMIAAYLIETGLELWQQPRATMFLHLHLRLLDMHLPPETVAQHLEKWTLDPEDFQSLLQQTYHALERHHEAFASYVNTLSPEIEGAIAHAMEQLQQPTLNLDSRLGRFYLRRNYQRAQHSARQYIQKYRSKQQLDTSIMHDWMREQKPRRRLYLRIFALQALAASVLPLDGEALQQYDALFGEHYTQDQAHEVFQLYSKTLEQLNPRRLKKWARQSEDTNSWQKTPDYVSDRVLSEDILSAVHDDRWETLEKWVQFKAYQSHLFRSRYLRPWQEVYQGLRYF